MSRTHLAALALAATTLAASGCGGSSGSTLTLSELIARADPICRGANEQLHTLHTATKKQDLARVAVAIAAYDRRASGELGSLTPPASMASDWKVMVRGYQTVAKDLSKVSGYAKAGGNARAEAEAIGDLSNAQIARAHTAHRDGFGVGDCTKY